MRPPVADSGAFRRDRREKMDPWEPLERGDAADLTVNRPFPFGVAPGAEAGMLQNAWLFSHYRGGRSSRG